ncbi:MAG: hypothetical protein ASARMPREDX12_001881 [Alectoria sarmentosa]|nr:MAG: hypothetical protein ASARMPREDX12_001881 [Alectoria sarmentosa]
MSSKAPSTPVWARPSKRARSDKPKLPAELESMVLDTFQDVHNPKDLTWLWVGGRHVSKHFRSEIERIFKTVILPETILRCDLGLHMQCWDVFTSELFEGHAGCHTNMSSMREYENETPDLTLDRFSDDQTRAFFKCGRNRIPQGLLFRRFHEKQLVGAPVFSIQVREVVNDTGLPNLQIDDEQEEISFSWKGMLDQLMGEEHVFNTILAQRLGWHLDPGEDFPNLLETHRKLARRSRLQRECRAKYSSNILDHYTQDEALALPTLQKLRLAASASESPYGDNNNDKYPGGYTKQEILDELPKDAIIYSGNSSPGRTPGSIPRGILTDRDYCHSSNPWRALPPPSAADLFSPRPLPDLSWGRRPMNPPQKRSNHRKRVGEEDPGRTVAIESQSPAFPPADVS